MADLYLVDFANGFSDFSEIGSGSNAGTEDELYIATGTEVPSGMTDPCLRISQTYGGYAQVNFTPSKELWSEIKYYYDALETQGAIFSWGGTSGRCWRVSITDVGRVRFADGGGGARGESGTGDVLPELQTLDIRVFFRMGTGTGGTTSDIGTCIFTASGGTWNWGTLLTYTGQTDQYGDGNVTFIRLGQGTDGYCSAYFDAMQGGGGTWYGEGFTPAIFDYYYRQRRIR